MDTTRKEWNTAQQELRQALADPDRHQAAVRLFHSQHAMVHAAEMSGFGLFSFQDQALAGLEEEKLRQIPPKMEHSLAWVLWHLTRIEDMTMNRLAASSPQVLVQEHWLGRLGVQQRDTGNGMDIPSAAGLSVALNLPALQEYRLAVGRRTQGIAQALSPADLQRRVEPAALEELIKEGDVLTSERGLLDYWGGLRVAGLLLMPPTRHSFVHWNEALRIRQKLT
jgi:uncharacterized damage-inducible protein DinB